MSLYNQRKELEKSVIYSLFGDWCDNPFEIEEWKKMIENLDVSLFTDKKFNLTARAIKKMNSLPEYEELLPTIDMVLAYVELNAPKVFRTIQEAIIEASEKSPLEFFLFKEVVKLLEQYKLKDEIRGL